MKFFYKFRVERRSYVVLPLILQFLICKARSECFKKVRIRTGFKAFRDSGPKLFSE